MSIAVRIISTNAESFGPEPPNDDDILTEAGTSLLDENGQPLTTEDA